MTANPIAITGMHRSGTSMITRGLHESGLHLIGGDADALIEAADDNPEGFWENKAIVACNDDLLEAAGGAWDNPPALLPQAVDDPRMAAIVKPATAALAGLAENDHWGFKDPRLCLTAAFWLDLQPDLKFIICVRNPLEVALSLKRRNQNSYSLGLTLWERYYESILELVPEDRRIITHYDSYFLDPDGELGRVCAFAGLEPAASTVRSDLRHHDVGVSLEEANLSAGIRSLYQRLASEAGTPVAPMTAVDEGHVRRLVLDGTVSARHAEQRQKAIERLEERLADARTVEKELRDQLSTVRKESDTRHSELEHLRSELNRLRSDTNARVDRLVADQKELIEQTRRVVDTSDTIAEMTNRVDASTQRIEDRQKVNHDRLERIDIVLEAVHVKLRAVENKITPGLIGRVARRFRGVFSKSARKVAAPPRRVAAGAARRGAPLAKKTVKASAARMPTPVKSNVHRVRRAIADGQAGNRLRERGEKVVNRLPSPAQKLARKGTAVVKSSGTVPKAARVAKGVARRLPAPARRLIGKAAAVPDRSPRPARAAAKSAPAPRPKQSEQGRTIEVPRGPAAFKWQKGYERMVSEFVTADTTWAVMMPGTKIAVDRVNGRVATPFPSADRSTPAADSISLIAIVEALRVAGHQRLVVPDGSRLWLRDHPHFRDYLARCCPTLVDREAAGIVFDLSPDAVVERRGLLTEINSLAADREAAVSVLDWTDADIAVELPGYTTFTPPDPSRLAYFDDSIEVVVTTDAHDLDEARRVGTLAVVVVDCGSGQCVVNRVELLDSSATDVAITVCAPSTETVFDAVLEARVAGAGATLVLDGDPSTARATSDVVIVLEPGVLPLPGTIRAAASAARSDPTAIVVSKVVAADGRLEAAGGQVFSDGSIAGIGGGSFDVAAPWHEYARPVCWGAGLFAGVSLVWTTMPAEADTVVDWCGESWAAGVPIIYRPRIVAVRATGAGPSAPVGEPWTDGLTTRPQRPDTLSDGAWRYLLANDDPWTLAPKAGA